ncbi:hypothetical protein DQ04_06551040 [Trypanosoma grayi]|uniref:hypothetical protein n=1 Tax=Trypanosoma grayi TaxID=71804 RepID=UPI0004F452D7|nr:hypothetical protein DQ04_06551040 [Trypanosoma grayi]KEG08734.1 hypothetical protein DQ04_06551040 [Trypanosoma grayi]
MESVEESLLQLQRLIADARRADANGGGSSSMGTGNGTSSNECVSIEEMQRRFAGLEEELFRERRLQQQARELHQRAEWRRRRRRPLQQQQEEEEVEQWGDRNVSVEEGASPSPQPPHYESSCLTAEGEDVSGCTLNTAEEVGVSCQIPQYPLSSPGSTIAPRQRSSTCEGRRHTARGGNSDGDGAEGEGEAGGAPCRTRIASRVADPGVQHLLVDITDGTARRGDDSCDTTPSYSFAQSYAGDERHRLLFIIDQLSHVLREERRQKEALLQHVVPVLVRHIEALERDAALRQREVTALKREVALQVELTRMLQLSSDDDDDDDANGGDGDDANIEERRGIERGRLRQLLLECERQLQRLAEHNKKGGMI